MEKYAFKMQLNKGCRDEYIRRHDAIWPDLVKLLKNSGVSDYSIYLDTANDSLFGVLWCSDEQALDALPESTVMQRWWAHMADIMEVNPDNSPVATPLDHVFHLD
ncbi:MAG: L-rhamnose mutarotase [Paracoccaceae bacterium]